MAETFNQRLTGGLRAHPNAQNARHQYDGHVSADRAQLYITDATHLDVHSVDDANQRRGSARSA
jgi:hypothetical protein